MPLYAVRMIADKSAIGLVYAETLTELCMTLDEIVQDNYCEYREIRTPAAIFFEGENGERCPWKIGTKDGPLAKVTADDATFDLVYKQRLATIGQSMRFDLELNSDLRDVMMGDTVTDGWQLVEPEPLGS